MFYINVKQLDDKVLQANHNDILRAPSRPWASSASCECVHERHRCPTLISPWKWWSESLERAMEEVTGVMVFVLYFLPSGKAKWRTTPPRCWQTVTQLWAVFTPPFPSLRLESRTLEHPFYPSVLTLPLPVSFSLSFPTPFFLPIIFSGNC